MSLGEPRRGAQSSQVTPSCPSIIEPNPSACQAVTLSAAGSVTGLRQTKRSQTYTAVSPSANRCPQQRDDLVGRPHGDHSARIEEGECGAGNRRVDGTGDRDLPRRAEPEVEAAEHPREPPGSAAKGRLDQAENGHCSAFELVVTPDLPGAEAPASISELPEGIGVS